MRQTSVSPDEWIRHRKLRKKIASAKWYARRKQRELDEQRDHRQRLHDEWLRQQQRVPYTWPDPDRRAEWHAVVAHHCLGYPVRPYDVAPVRWRDMVDGIERDIEDLRNGAREAFEVPTGIRTWLDETFVRKILRQMAVREIHHGHWTSHPEVPWCCTPPRHWATSVWAWLWVITHLGNHAEEFPTVWAHVHRHALRQPHGSTDPWYLLRSDPDCCRWIQTMSQNVATLVTDVPPTTTTSTTDSQTSDSTVPTDAVSSQPAYLTQPDTPEPYDEPYCSLTDTDNSESLPSSLDTFLNDTFTVAS